MIYLLTEPFCRALVSHKYTQHHTGKEETVQLSKQVFLHKYLEIHGFGSTNCLRASIYGYAGAGHFRNSWKVPADVDLNLPLRDKLNRQKTGQTVKTKLLIVIISVLVLCSSTCGPQLGYYAALLSSY